MENKKKEAQEIAERINEELRKWKVEEARRVFASIRGVKN